MAAMDADNNSACIDSADQDESPYTPSEAQMPMTQQSQNHQEHTAGSPNFEQLKYMQHPYCGDQIMIDESNIQVSSDEANSIEGNKENRRCSNYSGNLNDIASQSI